MIETDNQTMKNHVISQLGCAKSKMMTRDSRQQFDTGAGKSMTTVALAEDPSTQRHPKEALKQ